MLEMAPSCGVWNAVTFDPWNYSEGEESNFLLIQRIGARPPRPAEKLTSPWRYGLSIPCNGIKGG
jgi:hypothetical protein